MNLEARIRLLEAKVDFLEARVKSGRPPSRLNQAKEYLKKKSGLPVQDIITGSGFSHGLLSKARKELGYVVWQKEGIWYWGESTESGRIK